MKRFLIGLLATSLFATPAIATPAAAAPAPAAPVPALAGTQAAAQPALPDADPAMWVVRDEDTTIYLFGTFHLMDGRADWFNDEVRQAFDRSQELVFEIVLPEDPAQIAAQMQPLIGRYALAADGRTLSSRLSAEQNRVLNEALGTIGVPAGAFDPMEPWFINMMLTAVMGQKLGLNPENGAEAVLRRAAGTRMTLGAVETLEGQIQMFDSMPEEAQLTQLKQTLDNMNQVQEVLPRMLRVWNSGDTAGLDAVMNEGMSDPAMRRIMLGARNEKWAEWIDQRLDRPGTVFMAVGAGHLVGSDSVQTFLARRNIQSQRVPNLTPAR
ncbi:MAG TPA: TraB/GumN family protein [Allosphingosinicella sp.]|jgi:hypothetical protein